MALFVVSISLYVAFFVVIPGVVRVMIPYHNSKVL